MRNIILPVPCLSNYAGITIEKISLLTEKDFEETKDIIPEMSSFWWLQPSEGTDEEIWATSSKHIAHGGFPINAKLDVRPVLHIRTSDGNPTPGEWFRVGKHRYVMLKEDLAIACDPICTMPFRKDANAPDAYRYDASDVKRYLDGYGQVLQTLTHSYDIALFEKKNTDGLSMIELGCLYDLLDTYFSPVTTCGYFPISVTGQNGFNAIGLMTDCAEEALREYKCEPALHKLIGEQMEADHQAAGDTGFTAHTFKLKDPNIEQDGLVYWKRGLRIWLGR